MLEHNKIWEVKFDLGAIVPEFPSLPVGLGKTDARKSSLYGLPLCAGV